MELNALDCLVWLCCQMCHSRTNVNYPYMSWKNPDELEGYDLIKSASLNTYSASFDGFLVIAVTSHNFELCS